jgi:HAE1 family hydrophobic/amphiphilic exporter-1
MGIMPLVFATGAGAASRHSLGTSICVGMVVSSFLSLFIVPVIYTTIEEFTHARRQRKKQADGSAVESSGRLVGDTGGTIAGEAEGTEDPLPPVEKPKTPV